MGKPRPNSAAGGALENFLRVNVLACRSSRPGFAPAIDDDCEERNLDRECQRLNFMAGLKSQCRCSQCSRA